MNTWCLRKKRWYMKYSVEGINRLLSAFLHYKLPQELSMPDGCPLCICFRSVLPLPIAAGCEWSSSIICLRLSVRSLCEMPSIFVIFYYQISLNPLKTLSLSQMSFPLCYIFPYGFTNSDKGTQQHWHLYNIHSYFINNTFIS